MLEINKNNKETNGIFCEMTSYYKLICSYKYYKQELRETYRESKFVGTEP